MASWQRKASIAEHQKYFSDVGAFWREIKLHRELHVIEEEASKSIMHDTVKVVDTAIRNAYSTIKNVNIRLKHVNNDTVSKGIKKIKGFSVSDILPIEEESEANIKYYENMNEKN
ncbi:hypothetical protein RhiirA4_460430 [Rhizophagus irregularis]|uniref:Uncharacterized protein n=1 Tax=Rhizophagus irregularis TaxID=588596 RepID=A0A2I1GGM6_9GLOM|nr:hypothetical protein RhiirA4_460430 [Rhizophagus irregularis]